MSAPYCTGALRLDSVLLYLMDECPMIELYIHSSHIKACGSVDALCLDIYIAHTRVHQPLHALCKANFKLIYLAGPCERRKRGERQIQARPRHTAGKRSLCPRSECRPNGSRQGAG